MQVSSGRSAHFKSYDITCYMRKAAENCHKKPFQEHYIFFLAVVAFALKPVENFSTVSY